MKLLSDMQIMTAQPLFYVLHLLIERNLNHLKTTS